jgi:DNA-binding MarR family transcriptional regulator
MTNELIEKMAELQWLLHRHYMRSWAENGPMADTTRGQGRILAMLKMRDGISTKDLSYLLGLRVSSLNELLSKLEKAGYVTREPSEQDRRVMLVKLTEKGRNEEQSEPVDFSDIFSCLSDDEQQAFGEYLDRIIAALRASVGDDGVDMLERMAAIRERLGDRGKFFDGHGHGFPRERGFPRGRWTGFEPDGFFDPNLAGRHGPHDRNR